MASRSILKNGTVTIGKLTLPFITASLVASTGIAAGAVQYQIDVEREACLISSMVPEQSMQVVRIALYREYLCTGDMLQALKFIKEQVMRGDLP